MFGDLNGMEIEHLLESQRIGHLGVRGEDAVYVFPVAYGYDGAFAYFVSHEGLKVQLMRAHPEICLQVDDIASPARWRSAMLHGTFEELVDEAERDIAMTAIISQDDVAMPPSIAPYIDGPEKIVVYRLRVHEKTGRYERSEVLAHPR